MHSMLVQALYGPDGAARRVCPLSLFHNSSLSGYLSQRLHPYYLSSPSFSRLTLSSDRLLENLTSGGFVVGDPGAIEAEFVKASPARSGPGSVLHARF